MKKIIYSFSISLVILSALVFSVSANAATIIYLGGNVGDGTTVSCEALGMGFWTLRAGNQGVAVEVLQDVLANAGYYETTSNGIFGATTTSAVKAFQTEIGIKADGIVGPQTRTAMQTLCADLASGS